MEEWGFWDFIRDLEGLLSGLGFRAFGFRVQGPGFRVFGTTSGTLRDYHRDPFPPFPTKNQRVLCKTLLDSCQGFGYRAVGFRVLGLRAVGVEGFRVSGFLGFGLVGFGPWLRNYQHWFLLLRRNLRQLATLNP